MAVASASTRTSRRRRAPARSRSRSTTTHTHDLDAMLEEITAATRLVIVCNPNNPTSTALPLEEIAAFVARGPAPRRGDPRRGLLRVQPAAGPRRVDRRCSTRHPNLVLLRTFSQGLRAVRAARRLRAVRLGGVPHRGRPGAPAVLLQRRRPGRGGRGAQAPGRGRAPRRAQPRRADRSSRTGCARLGLAPAESQANFVWFDLPEDRASASSSPALVRARRARPRRRARSAARARCA